MSHKDIWEKVFKANIRYLRQLPCKQVKQKFGLHIANFSDVCDELDWQAGETKYVEEMLEKVMRTHTTWPKALLEILQSHKALLNRIQADFLKHHQKAGMFNMCD